MKKIICVLLLLVTAFIVYAQVPAAEYWEDLTQNEKKVAITSMIEGVAASLVYVYHEYGERQAYEMATQFYFEDSYTEVILKITAFYLVEQNREVPLHQAFLYAIGRIKIGETL